MTPEEKSLLERTYKLSEENNKILVSMRRSSRLTLFMRVGYWAVILILSFGAFYFIQPYFTALTGATGTSNILDDLKQSQDAAQQLKSLYQ